MINKRAKRLIVIVMSDISEVENIGSEDSVGEESFVTVKSDSEDFTTETNKTESPVNNNEATNTREESIGSENIECGQREMPLQTPEEGGDVEDRGTGYNFGKKWTYLNGNHICMNRHFGADNYFIKIFVVSSMTMHISLQILSLFSYIKFLPAETSPHTHNLADKLVLNIMLD